MLEIIFIIAVFAVIGGLLAKVLGYFYLGLLYAFILISAVVIAAAIIRFGCLTAISMIEEQKRKQKPKHRKNHSAEKEAELPAVYRKPQEDQVPQTLVQIAVVKDTDNTTGGSS